MDQGANQLRNKEHLAYIAPTATGKEVWVREKMLRLPRLSKLELIQSHVHVNWIWQSQTPLDIW